MRIDRREHHRLRAHGPVARTSGWRGPSATAGGADVRHLSRPPVVPCHLAAVDDVGIERIGRGIAVFLDAHRVPLAKRDLAVVAAAGDAHRTTILLPAADTVRKRVVRHHVIQRRRRLREPRAPRLSAVQRHDRALIDDHQHDFGIDRVPPDILVVVAAWCAFERRPRDAAVCRLVADDVGDDDRVGIDRVDVRRDLVDTAGGPRVGRDLLPRLAGVVGSVDACTQCVGAAPWQRPHLRARSSSTTTATPAGASSLNRCENALRTARRDVELRVDDRVGQPLLELFPRRPAVG